jgi:predicted Fe-Mo cluster-binding NifX family protein
MKLAISSTGKELTSTVDSRFGRAQFFIIYDTDTETFEVMENPNLGGAHGVGAKTAQDIANAGVKAILTGNVGPNAYNVLKAAKIDVFTVSGKTVQEAIDQFKNETLTKAEGATRKGHGK